MFPTTHAQLVCVLLLCALEDTVMSQRGHCAGNQCFAVFLEPEDNSGAKRSCSDAGGELLTYGSENAEKILNSLPEGRYWSGQHSGDRSAEADAAAQMCPSISVSKRRNFTVLREPCSASLNGFLCLYTFEQPCSGLQAGADTQVKYTTLLDLEVEDLETFPPGTTALAEKIGAKYPDSKYLCFSSEWMRAPWSCEVMQGGCEHKCSSTTQSCTCPVGKILNPNNITCSEGPCKDNPCTGEGEECKNTLEGFECICKEGFEKEDGVCMNVTICANCEHMCVAFNGVFECACRKGFRVSAHDPTKCEMICSERDCLGMCIEKEKNTYQCFCPDGYIQDITDTHNSTPFCTDINECETNQCDHKCENLFGSYRCLCDEGFKLHHDKYMCVPMQEEDDGSGSPLPYPTPADAHPAAVPSYIKTGSVLGITVFMALCAALLYCFIRNAVKSCGRFELSSLKHSDIDIFYLQQVTTETYKRLSFDKQFKNDS